MEQIVEWLEWLQGWIAWLISFLVLGVGAYAAHRGVKNKDGEG